MFSRLKSGTNLNSSRLLSFLCGQACGRFLLFGIVALPLESQDAWRALSFSKGAPNKYQFGKTGLHIAVDRSSSPIFYPFADKLTLQSISVAGTILDFPRLPREGNIDEFQIDDFALRVGIAEEGTQRLTWLKKVFAPGWVRELASLRPDWAFSRISFLLVAQTLPVGSHRKHSSSDRLDQEVVLQTHVPGPFQFRYVFRKAPRALGVWLQSDGDYTQSKLNVHIQSILIETEHES